jgi:hypothetical protein
MDAMPALQERLDLCCIFVWYDYVCVLYIRVTAAAFHPVQLYFAQCGAAGQQVCQQALSVPPWQACAGLSPVHPIHTPQYDTWFCIPFGFGFLVLPLLFVYALWA